MIISLGEGVRDNRMVRRIFVPMRGNVTRSGMVRYGKKFNKNRNKHRAKLRKNTLSHGPTKIYSKLTTKEQD